ncbi:MAG: FAD-dependent oxidoreductase [Silicimonas sp.]|nr:FAD-dependent oxidoreductase [Silicimonas sp.]
MSQIEAKRTVAIIGAGIVGVSTAIWCLRDGHDVILIDKKGPAEGTSFGNGGVLASCAVVPVTVPGLLKKAPQMLFDPNQPLFMKWSYLPKLAPWLIKYMRTANADAVHKRAAALTPIIGDSLADHQALAAGTGAEKWIRPSDYLYVYRDRPHFDSDAFGWNVRAQNGFTWETLEGKAFTDFDPCFHPKFGFATKMENHGRIADPGQYVKDLASYATLQGAKLLIGDVSDIVRANGAVTGVRVGGETVACDAAVVATGAWSGPLAKKLGLNVPLESERGYHLELWEPSVMPRAPVMIAEGKFVATPMDGRLRLAGVVEFGGLDAPRSRAPFALLERNIRDAIPGLTWKETREWMGHRPSISDSIPLIGEAPGLKGAYLGFGHDHVGLTGGPKTGRLLAQLISKRNPNIDLAPYSPARFAA